MAQNDHPSYAKPEGFIRWIWRLILVGAIFCFARAGYAILLLIPVLTYHAARHSLLDSVLLPALAMALTYAVYREISGMLFILLILPVSWASAWCIRRRSGFMEGAFIGSIFAAIGWALLVALFSYFTQVDLITNVLNGMRALLENPAMQQDETIQLLMSAMAIEDGTWAERVVQFLDIFDSVLRQVLPTILICLSAITGLLSYAVPMLYLKRLHKIGRLKEEISVPSFSNWLLPRKIVFSLLALVVVCWIGASAGSQLLASALTVVMSLFMLCYAVQGLAVAAYWMREAAPILRYILLLLVVGVSFFVQGALYIVSLIGVIDQGFNIRKISRPEGKKSE